MGKINKTHILTEDEKKFILEHLYDLSGPELSRIIGKSVKQIYSFARQRGYKHMLDGKSLLREKDLQQFLEMYPIYSNKYLTEYVFPYLDINQIRSVANKLGVRKENNLRQNHYDKKYLILKFQEAVSCHGRVPTLSEIKSWTGIACSTYRHYYKNIDNLCKEAQIERPEYLSLYKRNTDKVLKEKYYSLMGHKCSSIPEVIISNILYNQNINYIYDGKYSDYFEDFSCGSKRFDWYLPEYNIVIEYFGLLGNISYDRKILFKKQFCVKNNIELIDLYPKDIDNLNEQDFTQYLLKKIFKQNP